MFLGQVDLSVQIFPNSFYFPTLSFLPIVLSVTQKRGCVGKSYPAQPPFV
jgi:hypothetical protein